MATNPNVAHLSAHPSYLRPIDPEREANRQQRSKAGSAARSAQKEQCPNCLRMFSLNGIARHKATCLTGQKRYPDTRESPVSQGHTRCACGRIMSVNGWRCWKCQQPEAASEFAELDRLIAAGVTAPRRKL